MSPNPLAKTQLHGVKENCCNGGMLDHHIATETGQGSPVNAEQTAWVLNCQPHDIPVLAAARLLKPLGNPQPNSVKYYAALEVLELAKDRAWLSRMTNALTQYWQVKNAVRRSS